MARTHVPDSPFGCAVTWGKPVAVYGSDGRLHVCNRSEGHGESHRCKCGAVAGSATPTGDDDD
jgi:hypothetical protein